MDSLGSDGSEPPNDPPNQEIQIEPIPEMVEEEEEKEEEGKEGDIIPEDEPEPEIEPESIEPEKMLGDEFNLLNKNLQRKKWNEHLELGEPGVVYL